MSCRLPDDCPTCPQREHCPQLNEIRRIFKQPESKPPALPQMTGDQLFDQLWQSLKRLFRPRKHFPHN